LEVCCNPPGFQWYRHHPCRWRRCIDLYEGAYRSGDLDFVLLSFLETKLPEMMKNIGFQVTDGRHYKHPKCRHLFVEFSSGPPGIGEDYQIQPSVVRNEGKPELDF
jgi:hypothetical protein